MPKYILCTLHTSAVRARIVGGGCRVSQQETQQTIVCGQSLTLVLPEVLYMSFLYLSPPSWRNGNAPRDNWRHETLSTVRSACEAHERVYTLLFDVENDLKLNPVLAQCTTKYGERESVNVMQYYVTSCTNAHPPLMRDVSSLGPILWG